MFRDLPISESDISLAKASNALVIGFNVRAIPQARDAARRDGIDIRYYSIIYDVADDVKKGLEGLLSPELKEKILGYAEIREVYNITGVGKVAGCMITEGMVRRGAKVRLLRDNVVIHDGSLGQLKRFKDDVNRRHLVIKNSSKITDKTAPHNVMPFCLIPFFL